MNKKSVELVYEAQLKPLKRLFGEVLDVADSHGFAKGVRAAATFLRKRKHMRLAYDLTVELLPGQKL